MREKDSAGPRSYRQHFHVRFANDASAKGVLKVDLCIAPPKAK
jgi:hypothetical protein